MKERVRGVLIYTSHSLKINQRQVVTESDRLPGRYPYHVTVIPTVIHVSDGDVPRL